jgi:hypothetical protein
MCYNPAKNYQLDWYGRVSYTINTVGQFVTFKVIGIADYLNNPQNHPETVRIDTGTTTNYFIGFNRAYKINNENVEGDNMVTVIAADIDGESWSQSYLKATLMAGQTYTLPNYLGTPKGLSFRVDSIAPSRIKRLDSLNTSIDPWVATVTVRFG